MRSPAMDKAYTAPKVSKEREILFWGAWLLMFSVCGIVALAIRDNERGQLDRVHAAGMHQGYALCKAEGR